jgi:hypothetical protein
MNNLRHTFGSYHYALHCNENLTAAEMGILRNGLPPLPSRSYPEAAAILNLPPTLPPRFCQFPGDPVPSNPPLRLHGCNQMD